VAIVITALTVDGDASTGGDPFNAEQALRYITFLAIGYMISRGLAKAGARSGAPTITDPTRAERGPFRLQTNLYAMFRLSRWGGEGEPLPVSEGGGDLRAEAVAEGSVRGSPLGEWRDPAPG
jgi:hypothetical protein